MKIVVFQDESGAWRFRCVASNGRKLVVSEAYANKSNALRAARRFRLLSLNWRYQRARIEVES